jgi:hypothetical protein
MITLKWALALLTATLASLAIIAISAILCGQI